MDSTAHRYFGEGTTFRLGIRIQYRRKGRRSKRKHRPEEQTAPQTKPCLVHAPKALEPTCERRIPADQGVSVSSCTQPCKEVFQSALPGSNVLFLPGYDRIPGTVCRAARGPVSSRSTTIISDHLLSAHPRSAFHRCPSPKSSNRPFLDHYPPPLLELHLPSLLRQEQQYPSHLPTHPLPCQAC